MRDGAHPSHEPSVLLLADQLECIYKESTQSDRVTSLGCGYLRAVPTRTATRKRPGHQTTNDKQAMKQARSRDPDVAPPSAASASALAILDEFMLF